MARLNTYTQDGSVTGSDKVLGTDAASGVTKNFSLNSVSDWINDAGAVKIVGQNNYTFQAEGPLPADRRAGSISFQDFGGNGTLFADVTELIFSNASAGNNNAAQYLSSLVGKQVILADLSELANYGVYTLQSFRELDTEPGFYRGTLIFVSGTGALYDAVAYGFAAEGLQSQGSTWGSIAGTITDQADLVDYVDAEIAAIPTPETPTLQSVTDAGNTTTNSITSQSISLDAENGGGIFNSTYSDVNILPKNNAFEFNVRTSSSTGKLRVSTDGSLYLASNANSIKLGRLHSGQYPKGQLELGLNGSGYTAFFDRDGINELMRIDGATGNVGIGTTTPQQKLHVEGTIRIGPDVDLSRYGGRLYTAQDIVLGALNAETANITVNASNKSVLGVRRPSSGTVSVLKVRDYFTQDVYIDIDSDGVADFAGTVKTDTGFEAYRVGARRVFLGGTSTKGQLLLDNNGTWDVNFTGGSDKYFASGNFGIGTTSPTEKLHIQGNFSNNTFKVRPNSDHTIISSDQEFRIGTTNSADIFIAPNGLKKAVFKATGNVGIGTTAPTENLEISSSGTTTLKIGSTNSFGRSIELYTTGIEAFLDVESNFSIRKYDGNPLWVGEGGLVIANQYFYGGYINFRKRGTTTNLAQIGLENGSNTYFNTGNFGIGTTSPTEKLEVAGNVKVSNGNDNISIIPNNSTGSISTTSQAVQGAIISAVSDGFTFASRNVYGGVNIGSFNNAGTVTLGAFAYGNVNYQTAHNSFAHTWYGSRASDPWMTLNSTGLGIGTTSPAAKLDINGTTYLRSVALDTIFGYSGNNIQFINTGNTTFAGNVGIGTTAPSYPLVVKRTGSNVVASFEGDENTYLRIARTGTQSGEAQFRVTNTGNLSITSDSNISLTTGGVSGTTRLYVRNNDGNVGIGTTNPFAQLEIKKDSYTEARIRGNSDVYKHISLAHGGNFAYVTGSRSQLMLQSGDATYQYPMHFYTSGSARMVISPAGNVGIGTTSPDSKLQVNGTAMNQFRMQVPGGPSSNTDTAGREGDFAYDDQYLYVKTASGWGRVALDFGF